MRTDEAKWLMTGANDSRKDYRLHLCKVELRTLANHLRSVRANAANWSRNRSTATTTDTSRKLQCPKAQGVPRSMGREDIDAMYAFLQQINAKIVHPHASLRGRACLTMP